jgi:hypothetical protein
MRQIGGVMVEPAKPTLTYSNVTFFLTVKNWVHARMGMAPDGTDDSGYIRYVVTTADWLIGHTD